MKIIKLTTKDRHTKPAQHTMATGGITEINIRWPKTACQYKKKRKGRTLNTPREKQKNHQEKRLPFVEIIYERLPFVIYDNK